METKPKPPRYVLAVYDIQEGRQVSLTKEVAEEIFKPWVLEWTRQEEPSKRPRGRPPMKARPFLQRPDQD